MILRCFYAECPLTAITIYAGFALCEDCLCEAVGYDELGLSPISPKEGMPSGLRCLEEEWYLGQEYNQQRAAAGLDLVHAEWLEVYEKVDENGETIKEETIS